MKKASLSPRDAQTLSAYLDGQLSPEETRRLELRLARDPSLRSALDALRATRAALRRAPQRRAPRSFALTPRMVAKKPPLPRAVSWMQVASAAAAALFLLTFAFSSKSASAPALALAPQERAAQSAPPGFNIGGAEIPPSEAEEEAPAAVSSDAANSPANATAAPTATLAPTPTPLPPLPAPSPRRWGGMSARGIFLFLAIFFALGAFLWRRAVSQKWLKRTP